MIPCCDNKLRTVSEGCAPFANHCNANSSLIETSAGFNSGLYVPIVSMKRPSRGERESATTTRL